MPSDSEADRSDCRSSKRAKTFHAQGANDDHSQPAPPTPASGNVKAIDSSNSQGTSATEISCRKKQPLSCGECRRLKLKCDRVFPCRACVKRGCEGICPEGSLVSGRGSRYILANTEQLHEKIVQMSDRIRDLENALCTIHAQHCLCSGQSVSSHPLLQGPQLLVKAHLELYGIEPSRSNPNSPTSTNSSDALGDSNAPTTLSNAATDGQSLIFDMTASTENLFDTMSFDSVEGGISPTIPANENHDTAPLSKLSGALSDVNPPQLTVDLSMPSVFGGTDMFDISSFGHLTDPFTFDNPQTSAAVGKPTQPRPDSRPQISTDCGPSSSPTTPDLSASTPAFSLDRYFITWLTQLWFSHIANPNLPGAPHVPSSTAWNALRHLDPSSIPLPSSFPSPSVGGMTAMDDPATWMRLLTQHYGNYQPFS